MTPLHELYRTPYVTYPYSFFSTFLIGYVEAKVIPVGARNIRVEEVAAANNYLALMDNRGQYILNGNWYIQWSGDYEVAGTTVSYERVDNKERVVAQGPLQEPLHVMVCVKAKPFNLELQLLDSLFLNTLRI